MARWYFLGLTVCLLLLASSVEAARWSPFVPSVPRHNPYSSYEAGYRAGYAHRMGVPTYNWGYFGIRQRPNSIAHERYYNDSIDWTFKPGY